MIVDSLSETEIQGKLKSFECQRCNECCKKPGYVYLSEGESERIATSMNLDLYAFTEKYCEVIERRRLVLKKNVDEFCVFLTDNGCSVHDVKPEQCKVFPYAWRTAQSFNYCEGLKKIFN